MDESPAMQAANTTPSPAGELIASVWASHLRVHHPARPTDSRDYSIRSTAKDILSLVWSPGADQVAVLSAQSVEVVDLQDQRHRVRLDNGVGGLGRFLAIEFMGHDLLFVTWEFGRSKMWNLRSGKGVETQDVKTMCDGARWAKRPGYTGGDAQFALLSRQGAEDYLTIMFPEKQSALPPSRLKTMDAQALCWSPDGKWLSVLDSPSSSSYSVHIYTPDGQCFRSCPATASEHDSNLGVKYMFWSPDSKALALASHDSRITLLNGRTFSAKAVIEHSTVIEQGCGAREHRAHIWQETVSPAHVRSYKPMQQPFSLPLSRPKQTSEPTDLGIAELCFSDCGRFLATRDERMLSTVWVWDLQTLSAYSVIVQHANVRRMQWSRTMYADAEDHNQHLLIDCGEGVAYLWSPQRETQDEPQPPAALSAELKGNVAFNFLPGTHEKPAILASTKGSFQVMHPYGASLTAMDAGERSYDVVFQEDHIHIPNDQIPTDAGLEEVAEDSLLDLLSGRKPMPDKLETSYTEMIDAETENATATGELQDTFRGKRLLGRSAEQRVAGDRMEDPFDDSEIF